MFHQLLLKSHTSAFTKKIFMNLHHYVLHFHVLFCIASQHRIDNKCCISRNNPFFVVGSNSNAFDSFSVLAVSKLDCSLFPEDTLAVSDVGTTCSLLLYALTSFSSTLFQVLHSGTLLQTTPVASDALPTMLIKLHARLDCFFLTCIGIESNFVWCYNYVCTLF